MSKPARKVLFVTLEPVSAQMAGPAIRCVELARQLAGEFEVCVFSPRPSDLASLSDGVELVSGAGRKRVYALAADADVLFIQANVLKPYPRLASLAKHLVVDLYDPYLLSVLAQYAADEVTASSSYRLMHQLLERHMVAADFSVCASERQRDYWIGRYCAIGRLTPELYRLDPSFRKLIDVVPFGLPSQPPQRSGHGMKGRISGISPSDYVLLWGGGLWEWFDPLTVIQAVAQVGIRHPEIRLFFMGWRSPNPQVEIMPMALAARQLAADLGVLDRQVFFGSDWIPYSERVNYLLDADAAVSAHFDLPETRFSFRTRVLDYLWCGLPILTTGGDHLADMIERHGAGLALPYRDVGAWARAIEKLMDDPALADRFRSGSRDLSLKFHWQDAVAPLRQYCLSPHKLPPFTRVRMPSLMERMRAVYHRGGTDLVIKRSKDLIGELLSR